MNFWDDLVMIMLVLVLLVLGYIAIKLLIKVFVELFKEEKE